METHRRPTSDLPAERQILLANVYASKSHNDQCEVVLYSYTSTAHWKNLLASLKSKVMRALTQQFNAVIGIDLWSQGWSTSFQARSPSAATVWWRCSWVAVRFDYNFFQRTCFKNPGSVQCAMSGAATLSLDGRLGYRRHSDACKAAKPKWLKGRPKKSYHVNRPPLR